MPLDRLFITLNRLYPQIQTCSSNEFRWSPETRTIHYIKEALYDSRGILLLMHEFGHAKLNHTEIRNDIDLLRKEVQAWTAAQRIASELDVQFDEGLAENCLDTYRIWVDRRSTCPTCKHTGYQDCNLNYRCVNCENQWKVSLDQTKRVCRVSTK